ncbi:MAG: hypothetical protein ACOZBL_05570 [Patescibacteria group bacterium]
MLIASPSQLKKIMSSLLIPGFCLDKNSLVSSSHLVGEYAYTLSFLHSSCTIFFIQLGTFSHLFTGSQMFSQVMFIQYEATFWARLTIHLIS